MQGKLAAAKLIFKSGRLVSKTGLYVANGAAAVAQAAIYCARKSDSYLIPYAKMLDESENAKRNPPDGLEKKVEKADPAADSQINSAASSSSLEKKFDPKSPTPIKTKKRAKSDEEGGSSQVLFLKPPGNAELLKAYKSLGLVGEENNALIQTFAAAHGMSFGIEGSSGSGKSHTINLLMELLPRDAVYTMELSSKTAEMYNCDEINQAKIIYIPELQKAIKGNPVALEIIKNLTEGRDAVRRVKAGAAMLEQRIDGNKAVIYTLAAENLTKKDAELTRRFFTLYTDSSEEQTARIMEYLALGQYSARGSEEKSLVNRVRKHLECSMALKENFVNPFAPYLVEALPKTLDMRSKVKHYLQLINASARFHHYARCKGNGAIFTSLEDVFNINSFCTNSSLGGFAENFDYNMCLASGFRTMDENSEWKDYEERWEDLEMEYQSNHANADFIDIGIVVNIMKYLDRTEKTGKLSKQKDKEIKTT